MSFNCSTSYIFYFNLIVLIVIWKNTDSTLFNILVNFSLYTILLIAFILFNQMLEIRKNQISCPEGFLL
jgi:hypothetical protein